MCLCSCLWMKRWTFNSFLLLLNWSAEDPTKRPKSVVDVGCGIGGSSRYIASKFGAKCQGITLSPVQAQRANALAAAQGLSDKVNANSIRFSDIQLVIHILVKMITKYILIRFGILILCLFISFWTVSPLLCLESYWWLKI